MSYGNDNNYGNLPSTQQRRTPGCSPIFLIIVGVALFILYTSSFPQQKVDDPQNPQSDWEQVERGATPRGADAGDWSVEEVDVVPSANRQADDGNVRDKTKGKDGWSMEDVETTGSKKSDSRNSLDLQLPTEPKKTQKGDWGIEEVEKGGR